METLRQKLSSYRFIIFCITILFTIGVYFICRWCPALIALNGSLTAIIGLAGVLIGGKTFTDLRGKK